MVSVAVLENDLDEVEMDRRLLVREMKELVVEPLAFVVDFALPNFEHALELVLALVIELVLLSIDSAEYSQHFL